MTHSQWKRQVIETDAQNVPDVIIRHKDFNIIIRNVFKSLKEKKCHNKNWDYQKRNLNYKKESSDNSSTETCNIIYEIFIK